MEETVFCQCNIFPLIIDVCYSYLSVYFVLINFSVKALCCTCLFKCVQSSLSSDAEAGFWPWNCVRLFRLKLCLQVIRRTVTAEGEVIPVCQLDIQVENPLRSNGVFLVSPLIVSHTMERGSPLYELSAQSLASEDLEIIVILEGQNHRTII